eukprot:CAMPEP_0196659034 /NCGR_PEP_ID=MMETSP1086-20130531/32820_1 /TAXON_ID=77921 /ORGANISM="Cyanoptyche  gloeocystis , Strain SAG4.97" /LENGTH=192 /DNA_ID=CAMNT_0041992857 /DNA_START=156 /DNA_END=734 /DNA_ORIENTATION=-
MSVRRRSSCIVPEPEFFEVDSKSATKPEQNMSKGPDAGVYLGGCPVLPWDNSIVVTALRAAGIKYFAASQEQEDSVRDKYRRICGVLLYWIACYPCSMETVIEATEQIALGRNVVIVVHRGKECEDPSSCARLRRCFDKLAGRNGARVFSSLGDAVGDIVAEKQNRDSPTGLARLVRASGLFKCLAAPAVSD